MQEIKGNVTEETGWFNELPEDWQSWVVENLERGCDPQGIGQILHEHGFRAITGANHEIVRGDGDDRLALLEVPPSNNNAVTESTTKIGGQSGLSHDWKKWLAQCVMNKVSVDHIFQVLRDTGFSDVDIQVELAQLQQNPYFELAKDIHLQLQKRNWLMNTIDHLARLNIHSAAQIDKIKTPKFSYFMKHYYSQHRPVVLTHGIDHWPALKKWNPDYFLEKVGGAMVEVQQGRDKDPLFERHSAQYRAQISMAALIDQIVSTNSSNNIYMTANNAAKNASGISALFSDIADFGEGYTQADHARSRSFLWFGPKGTYTPLHHDLTNNMLVQIYGRKKVTLVPALQVPYLYNDKGVYSEIYNPNDKREEERYPLLKQVTTLEYILQPGEALFIPIGWWHCVESLDISMSISFTHFNAENNYSESFPN